MPRHAPHSLPAGRSNAQGFIDYNFHYVQMKSRPQNFIRESEPCNHFMDYPKLDKLKNFKQIITTARATPPRHIKADIMKMNFQALGTKFDVILIDPPWEEYYTRCGGMCHSEDLTPIPTNELAKLRIDSLGDNPSFLFLWCGAASLEDGRSLMAHWGYRRCEDIVWLKTNKRFIDKNRSTAMNEMSYLHRVKEHCLMGIKGNVKRSVDTHFIHCNLDTDVIVDEEPQEFGSTAKPHEIYDIIGRFCMGRRKVELFASDRNIRPGWLSVGNAISITKFDPAEFNSWFLGEYTWPTTKDYVGGRFEGTSEEIENLRPKSPARNTQN